MGAAFILVVFMVCPNVYADADPSVCSFSNMFEKFVHQLDEFIGRKNMQNIRQNVTTPKRVTAIQRTEYVPKSPRRPIILVWPSVMNPGVTAKRKEKLMLREQETGYLQVLCENNTGFQPKIEEPDIIQEFDEATEAPTFFSEVVPHLILWLSAEVLECGFYTIFNGERKEIYRFIEANQEKWVKTLQELLYILFQVLAVIHHKTNPFDQITYGPLDWLNNWPESYEKWLLASERSNVLHYIQSFISDSLDIVTTWLFDYLGQRAREEPVQPFWDYADHNNWKLSKDIDIVCALENYDVAPAWGWDYMLEAFAQKRRTMETMEKMFMMCEVDTGCTYKTKNNLFYITVGMKDNQRIVKIPSPQDCTLKCNELSELSYNLKTSAYAHAYMTTAAGHDVYCDTSKTKVFDPEIPSRYSRHSRTKVKTSCYPMVVKQYITVRMYNLCKSSGCKKYCCQRNRQSCELVTDKHTALTHITRVNLTRESTRFPDLEKLVRKR